MPEEESRVDIVMDRVAARVWPLWAIMLATISAWSMIAGHMPSTFEMRVIGIVPLGVTVLVTIEAIRATAKR